MTAERRVPNPVWTRKVEGFLEAVTFKVRPKPSVRMSLVIVGTGSQQKVRKKRTETDRAVCLAVLWNRGAIVEGQGGHACWTEVLRVRAPLEATFLPLRRDVPILCHVGKKYPPFATSQTSGLPRMKPSKQQQGPNESVRLTRPTR